MGQRMSSFRWGIMGTGRIARQFAIGLRSCPRARLQAVGSRTLRKARSFAEETCATTAHGSYEALAADPQVDIVYVATPHSCHAPNTELALNEGKSVLCEKPLCINSLEAARLIMLARQKKLFLMEAMWTRYFPLMRDLMQRVTAGELGCVRMVTADFGFKAEVNEDSRLFNAKVGGGALLDVGVYPLSLASMLLGNPTSIKAFANTGLTGVDEVIAMILDYPDGQCATLSAAITLQTNQEARIFGTEGAVTIHQPWWKPCRMTFSRTKRPDLTLEFPYVGNGYNYEADEVMNCLEAGQWESPLMPLDESLSIMKTVDGIFAQIGIKHHG